jgi:hypothetical protein
MADQLHMSLSQFRDTMLTAVARLEFQIRDTLPNQKQSHALDSSKVICVCPDVEEVWPDTSSTRSAILPEQRGFDSALLQSIVARLEVLEERLSSLSTPVPLLPLLSLLILRTNAKIQILRQSMRFLQFRRIKTLVMFLLQVCARRQRFPLRLPQ